MVNRLSGWFLTLCKIAVFCALFAWMAYGCLATIDGILPGSPLGIERDIRTWNKEHRQSDGDPCRVQMSSRC